MSDDIMSSYDLLLNSENLREFVDQTNGAEVIGLPDGRLEIYIERIDSIHTTNDNAEFINGMNSEIPDLDNTFKRLVTKDGVTTVVDATIGAEAELFVGYMDLNPESPTFGMLDTDYGFKNVRIWHPQWSGVGRYRADGLTGGGREWNTVFYEAIRTHPNYKVAVMTQLYQLDQYADTYNLDKDVLIEKLRKNNPELADLYESVVDKSLNCIFNC